MSGHGKRYRSSLEAQPVPGAPLPIPQAVAVLRKYKPAKFDETVELSMRLGIDPKQADQLVRGSFSMPRGLGKTVRVIVFAGDAAAKEARDAGALEVGGDDLIKKVAEGWLDFDVAVAHPEMMAKVGRLGKVLGPQGKMPSPKSGTVTPKVGEAVKAFQAGKIEYRNDDSGNLHVPVGKRSFPDDALVENLKAFSGHILANRPAGVKGTFLHGAAISLTMSPSVKVVL
ncbi:MAG: 50S ribosomal protein L1 [Planctomycetes bacterium]|nr:50S ribosomal protein L1 [Planctomycetota bacterium]